jgi:catechol 2,3-dioxygenase-like lactoylglutathione lyase family enzyme
MAETRTSTHLSAVGRVMIPVTDQDRAIEFYRDKLGFELRADIPFGDGNRWIEVGPPGAPTALALVQPREGDPVGVDTRIALDTTDIDADHAELRSRGVDVDPEVARMGGPVPPMFWMRDQDGNTLMVVEPSE